MSAGLAALLDDVAALTRVAAASLDDVAAGAGRARMKAAGVGRALVRAMPVVLSVLVFGINHLARSHHPRADTVLSVVLAADIQMIIGSGMPVVLAIGFGAILVLRRRDRRRGDPGDRQEADR